MSESLWFTLGPAALFGWLGGRWWGVLVVLAAPVLLTLLVGWRTRRQALREDESNRQYAGWWREWEASHESADERVAA